MILIDIGLTADKYSCLVSIDFEGKLNYLHLRCMKVILFNMILFNMYVHVQCSHNLGPKPF